MNMQISPFGKMMKYLKYVLALGLVVVVIYNFKFAQFQISTQLKVEPATTETDDPKTDQGLAVNLGEINYHETVGVTEHGEEPPDEIFSEETTQQLQPITVENEIDENLLYENVRPGVVRLTPTGMQSIENEATHELSMQEPYKYRMTNIRQNCVAEDIDTILDLSRYIYNDKHKFIMCVVPKAACTSWKRFWWHLAGFDGYKTVEGEKLIINRGYITTLNELPVHEALTKLKEYTTFFIQRHPFARLVSAHSDKFTTRHNEDNYKKLKGTKAANKFLPPLMHNIKIRKYMGSGFEEKLNQSLTYQELSTEERDEVHHSVVSLNVGEIDFDIFIKMVIGEYQQRNPEKVNVHWRNSIDLCNPCAVNFDYVINFDNLHEDSNRLLEYLQRNDPEENKVFFGSRRRNLVNSNYTYDKLHSLPKKTVVELLQIYKRDLDVFGFDDMNS